jgi:hypothetical protein
MFEPFVCSRDPRLWPFQAAAITRWSKRCSHLLTQHAPVLFDRRVQRFRGVHRNAFRSRPSSTASVTGTGIGADGLRRDLLIENRRKARHTGAEIGQAPSAGPQ